MTDYKEADAGVAKFLGPPNEDMGGSFYMVEGTDGSLYRMNQASHKMMKLVNKGDWAMFSDTAGDRTGIQNFQRGIDLLEGKQIILADNYPDNYISKLLMQYSEEGYAEESKAIDALTEQLIEDPDTSGTDTLATEALTLEQDQELLPKSDSTKDLKDFVSEDIDALQRELEKEVEIPLDPKKYSI